MSDMPLLRGIGGCLRGLRRDGFSLSEAFAGGDIGMEGEGDAS